MVVGLNNAIFKWVNAKRRSKIHFLNKTFTIDLISRVKTFRYGVD